MTYELEDGSVFDQLRQVDERGEYWSARDFVIPLGYERWDRFLPAIERAEAACGNAGHDPRSHMAHARRMLPIGNGAFRQGEDRRLTRFGAYLVTMNGDPRKPEIAEAQTYFAIRTREAEMISTAIPADADPLIASAEELVRSTQLTLETIRRQRALEGRVDRVEAKVDAREGRHDWYAALGYARLHGHETSQRYLSRVGMRAAALARADGVKPERVRHALFGEVNELPERFWRQAFAEVSP